MPPVAEGRALSRESIHLARILQTSLKCRLLTEKRQMSLTLSHSRPHLLALASCLKRSTILGSYLVVHFDGVLCRLSHPNHEACGHESRPAFARLAVQ